MMRADCAKLTAGWLLAEGPGLEDPVVQYGLVGLITWMVVRECFSLIRLVLDRKGKKNCNSSGGDHDELVRIRTELEALKDRVGNIEGDRS